MAVRFVVARIDKATRQCSMCGGVGFTSKTVRGEVYKKQCTAYGCQNGVVSIEHKTEVNLLDALRELGLIK